MLRARNQMERVRTHFHDTAESWDALYQAGDDLSAAQLTIQERQAIVLGLLRDFGLPDHGVVYDIGCGSGRLPCALPDRVRYVGVDFAHNMLVQANANLVAHQRDERAMVLEGNVEHLPLRPRGADATLALGVLEYLPDTAAGLTALIATVKPGGLLVVTVPSRRRLGFGCGSFHAIDTGLRRAARSLRAGARLAQQPFERRLFIPRAIPRLFRRAGVHLLAHVGHGYGPFVLFGRRLLSDRTERAAHRHLSRLAQTLPAMRMVAADQIYVGRVTHG